MQAFFLFAEQSKVPWTKTPVNSLKHQGFPFFLGIKLSQMTPSGYVLGPWRIVWLISCNCLFLFLGCAAFSSSLHAVKNNGFMNRY